MKLLTTAFLLVLTIAAVRAQNAAVVPPVAAPLAGYLVVFPQVPVTTIRFDGNSEDIAKLLAPHPGTSLNHDGAAFKAFGPSLSLSASNGSVGDFHQFQKNATEYQKNVKSGKWHRFANGE